MCGPHPRIAPLRRSISKPTIQYTRKIDPNGLRQYIVLQDPTGAAQITVILDIYENQPVLRYSLVLRNLKASPVYVTGIDMTPWSFADAGREYTALRVNQWSVVAPPADFEPLESVLDASGTEVEVYSGAGGRQCGWVALRCRRVARLDFRRLARGRAHALEPRRSNAYLAIRRFGSGPRFESHHLDA